MSHAVTATGHATLADYEAFVEQRADDERWELIDGVIGMTTNPTENHGQIVGNVFAALKPAVDQRRCRAYAGSTRVQKAEARTDDMAVIPDVLVRYGPSSNSDDVPILIP